MILLALCVFLGLLLLFGSFEVPCKFEDFFVLFLSKMTLGF